MSLENSLPQTSGDAIFRLNSLLDKLEPEDREETIQEVEQRLADAGLHVSPDSGPAQWVAAIEEQLQDPALLEGPTIDPEEDPGAAILEWVAQALP